MKKYLCSILAACALMFSASAFAQHYDYRYDNRNSQRYDQRYYQRYDNRADRYVHRNARDLGYYNGAGRYAPAPRYVNPYDRGYYQSNRYNRYNRNGYVRCAPNNDRVRDRNQAAIAGAVVGGLIGSQTGSDNGYNNDQAARAAAGALAGAALGYGIGNSSSSRYDCW